jgi:TRAP-type C4-dicarboxylate transport system permease large subunit
MLLIIFGILLVVMFLGAPVKSAMGFTAVCAMLLFMGTRFLPQIGKIAINQGTGINQIIAPMFILMAEFLSRGGIAEDIFAVLNRGIGKIKGGLAISTTLACTIFAALCGSSPATAASVGRISISEMTKRKYDPSFAVGTVAAGGTLGIMIPPSLAFLLYGIITETSIVKLLMAGIVPGLMLSALLCLSIVIRVRANKKLIDCPNVAEHFAEPITLTNEETPVQSAELCDALDAAEQAAGRPDKKEPSFLRILPALLLIFVVLGSMYLGWATPMEAAAYGVIGAFLIILFQGRLTKKLIVDSFKATAKTGTMIVFLIILGFCMSYVISYLGIASKIAEAIVASGLNKHVIMILIYILWFIMGCLMDPSSMVILTVPFIFPTLTALGFDPLWIGVVATLSVEIGMITPPVGLNLFVLRSNSGLKMSSIIKGSLPYVLVMIIGLVLITLFPSIATWLPSIMYAA